MELVTKHIEDLTTDEILDAMRTVGLTVGMRDSNMYKLLLSILIEKSYFKREILETKHTIHFEYYLGYYLYYAFIKKDSDLESKVIFKLKNIVKKYRKELGENFVRDFHFGDIYNGYIIDISKNIDIEALVYLVNVMRDIVGDDLAIVDTLNYIFYKFPENVSKEVVSSIDIEPINIIKSIISHDYFMERDLFDIAEFLLEYYVNKGEIKFSDVIKIVKDRNNTDIDRWFNELILNQV